MVANMLLKVKCAQFIQTLRGKAIANKFACAPGWVWAPGEVAHVGGRVRVEEGDLIGRKKRICCLLVSERRIPTF